MVLCPYCGSLSTHQRQCSNCHGYFDLLSRQRSQNAMGPWFIRDVSKPFQPGCSYDTLVKLVQRGRIKPETVIRGPATRQFWTFARNAPGIAHILGECHSCHEPVMPIAKLCPKCRASFVVEDDRQHMGLSPVHLLPGDADAATIAASLRESSGAVSNQAADTQPTSAETQHPRQSTDSFQQPVTQVAQATQPATHNDQVQQVAVSEGPAAPDFPEPEVKVILADDERTSSNAGVIISVAIAFIVVTGAGFWAWSYLSERTSPESALALETSQVESDSDQLDGQSGQAHQDDEATPPTDEELAERLDPAAEPEVITPNDDASSGDDPSSEESEAIELQRSQDEAHELAYDRVLVGIASGNLDEEQFRSLLDQVAPTQRATLEEMWVRRQDQVRLGRDGG
ncbi:MAG: hypothetical protein Phyf2KO_02420 [Phycisphaerales bacterium]